MSDLQQDQDLPTTCPHDHGEGCLAYDMPEISRCQECQ